LYLSKPGSTGIKNNLVRAWPQDLGEQARENVYNLIRLFVSNQNKVATNEMTGKEAALLEETKDLKLFCLK